VVLIGTYLLYAGALAGEKTCESLPPGAAKTVELTAEAIPIQQDLLSPYRDFAIDGFTTCHGERPEATHVPCAVKAQGMEVD
jgi:hypothetical protein